MSYVTPSKVFAHAERIAGWQAGEKPAPVTVEWDLSNRCTLGCQHCHFAHTHTRGPWASRERDVPATFSAGGDVADVELVTRGLGELADAGVRAIVWSGGGEPTTHPHWQRIVQHAATLGLSQGMYTLGGLLTPESAAVLAQHLTWVVVSLDAATADSYGVEKNVHPDRFDAACDGIRRLTGGRATVGVSFLLHEDNWTAGKRMLRLARQLGADYATFRPTVITSPSNPTECTQDRGWISAAMPILRWLARQDDVECNPDRFVAYRDWQGRSYPACYGVRMNATITPDGRVWLCPQHRGVEGSCIGDLSRESFAELWARHPGEHTDFSKCRVMCRLHLVNQALDAAFRPYQHEEFV